MFLSQVVDRKNSVHFFRISVKFVVTFDNEAYRPLKWFLSEHENNKLHKKPTHFLSNWAQCENYFF